MDPRHPKRHRLRLRAAIAIAAAILCGAAPVAAEEDFEHRLWRIDQALRTNPKHVSQHALESCLKRRNFAAKLHDRGQRERAERSIEYCFRLLEIPSQEEDVVAAAPSLDASQKRAAAEIERALALEPDPERGLGIYRECALCHMPEGWGLENGLVPQIAGQHRSVVIKQLADIRAGNRDVPAMRPYASVDAIGGAQAVADVAGYIETLEISVATGKGPGKDLALGGKLYAEKCASCHGAAGEGDAAKRVPRIQAQHYRYLVRQLEEMRAGRRQNADPEMMARVRELDEGQTRAVLDYVSRLTPPPELQAPPGWENPDFPDRTHYDYAMPQPGDPQPR